MASFELDFSELIWKLGGTAQAAKKGAIRGMHDALDDWQRIARDEAPIKTGQLRRLIETKIESGSDLEIEGQIISNAYKDDFNYAYYQHEVKGNKYLDRAAEGNVERWVLHIEKEVADEIIKAGWK